MENITGKQLGPYQILAPLGEGGMAAVYKAYQPGVERQVALKVLPRQLAKNPEFVARFKREAGVLAQLQHPHILPVFDFGEADDYTYIVMPLLKSGTLSEQLNGKILPWDEVEQVISQLSSALDYAHSKGIIHRDIKPSNVLIDEQHNCLLTDFGIAKIVSGGDDKLTGTGHVMGTPAYMSPEQGRGVGLDQRSDIYSLGVILYEMVTGRVPYKAETPLAVMVNDPLPLPSTLNPNVPEAIEFVIIKSLAKQPEQRFEHAGDMANALKKAIAQQPLTDSEIEDMATLRVAARPAAQGAAQTIQTKRQEKSGKGLVWMGVAAILLLLLGGGGAFLAMGGLNSATSPPTGVSQAVNFEATNTPEPANTPDEPTDIAEPTATNTPAPTNTPIPTNTPAPTNTPVPTNTAVPTITNTPTQVIDTEFPLPDNISNYFKAASDDDINFQTELSVDELFEFYKQELTAQGLVEREINTARWDGGFSIVFDGAPNGKATVVQVTDLGVSSPTDARNVNIRYEDI